MARSRGGPEISAAGPSATARGKSAPDLRRTAYSGRGAESLARPRRNRPQQAAPPVEAEVPIRLEQPPAQERDRAPFGSSTRLLVCRDVDEAPALRQGRPCAEGGVSHGIDQRTPRAAGRHGRGSGQVSQRTPSHADQMPSVRLGLSTSRAASGAEHRKDHARGTEALISRPCSMLVLARGNRLWRRALQRPQGTLNEQTERPGLPAISRHDPNLSTEPQPHLDGQIGCWTVPTRMPSGEPQRPCLLRRWRA